MKKRLISFFVCMSLFLCMINVQAAEVSGNERLVAQNFMAEHIFKELGIITSNTDIEGVLEQKVSRATFVDMLAKIMNISRNDIVYFDDVPMNHWACGSVNALVDMDVISISDMRTFNPDDIITYDQACKIMLCAAGYGDFAENLGGYPSGYRTLAIELELGDNVLSTGELSLSDVINIMWNGVTIPNYVFDTSSARYNTTDETILSRYRDYYISTGVLTDYCGATLNNVWTNDDEVYIDEKLYNVAENFDVAPYFAKEIEFVYHKNSRLDEETVTYMQMKDDNEVIKISSENLIGFLDDSYAVRYYKDKDRIKEASEKISRGATVIYNGKPYTGSIKEVFEEFKIGLKRGTVEIIRTDDSDIVVIESFRPFVVSIKDSENIIYNKYNAVDYIDLSKAENIALYDINESKYNSELAVDNVLMLAQSKDGEFIKIVVLGYNVSGSVTGISYNEGSVEVDGREYYIDKNCIDEDGIKLGQNYAFAVDSFGYIVAYEHMDSADEMLVGWLIKGTGFEDGAYTFNFKIFSENGTISEYDLADRVVFDGTVLKKDKLYDLIFKDATIVPDTKAIGERIEIGPQLIRYRITEENKIKEIDTSNVGVNENEDYTLTMHKTVFDRNGSAGDLGLNRFFSRNVSGGTEKIIDGNIPFSTTATKVFSVPRTDRNGYLVGKYVNGLIESNYSDSYEGVDVMLKDKNGDGILPDDRMYSTKFEFVSGRTNVMDIYQWNKDNVYADCVVVHEDAVSKDRSWYMVKAINSAVDENGDEIYILQTQGSQFNVRCSLEDINIGDIVKLDKNAVTGDVYAVTKAFDAKTKEFTNKPPLSRQWEHWWYGSAEYPYHLAAQFQITRGRVMDMKGDFAYIDWDGDLVYDEVVVATKIPITVYDSAVYGSKSVYSGSVSDILTYEAAGDDCSMVLHAYYSTAVDSGLFIYK